MRTKRTTDQSVTKDCEQCGREFSKPAHLSWPNWPKRRFCTNECHLAATQVSVLCPICGVAFKRRYGGQRTCGAELCKSKLRRTVTGPAASQRMKADYASGARKKVDGLSPRERVLLPLMPEGWVWRLRWAEPGGRAFELDFALWGKDRDTWLNVEIDGVEHRWPSRGLARDAERDAELEARGWRVLRISNAEVDADPVGVVERIELWAQSTAPIDRF